MAVTDLTYLQLRQQIVGDLNRDDLDVEPLSDSSVVHQYVKGRVNYYNKEFFYSAQFIDTSKSTADGNPWVNLPSGWQDIKLIRLLYNGIWVSLTRVPLTSILQKDTLNTPTKSLPAEYALYQNPTGGAMAARFFPVPNAVYSVEFTMDKPPDAPSTDAEVSFWTTDAPTLIKASVCEKICRERINRPLKATEHQKTREDEELSLNSKTIRIMGGIQAKAWF